MGAKGGGKNCCCGGCGAPIRDLVPAVNLDPQEPSDLLPQVVRGGAPLYCLACMPYALCLRSTYRGHTLPSLVIRKDPDCLNYPWAVNQKSYWTGYVFIQSAIYTVNILFDVDLVNGRCWLCLQILDLGITGSEAAARILIDESVRQAMDQSCQRCTDFRYPPTTVQWTITVGGFPLVVTITPCDIISTVGTLPCPGCGDPCDSVYGTVAREATLPNCNTICLGCECLGQDACIAVSVDGEFRYNHLTKACNYSWVTPEGTAIGLDADPATGQCRLRLVAVGGVPQITDTLPQSVLVGTVGNPCPWPTASWRLSAYGNHHVQVIFNPAQCGTCDSLRSIPCCPAPVPRMLYATFDGSPCSLETLTIPIFDSTLTGDSAWVGQSATGALGSAFGTPKTVMLQLFCQGLTGWILKISYDDGKSFYQVTSYSGSCDPVHFVFNNVPSAGLGDCKCQPPFFPKCNNFTVTITE